MSRLAIPNFERGEKPFKARGISLKSKDRLNIKSKIQKVNTMVRYCKQINFNQWRDKLENSAKRMKTKQFSIVYRFYSTLNGAVRYVGRSNRPFNRESGHWTATGSYMVHDRLKIKVVYVDFCYFKGRWCKLQSFKEECKQYHIHEPEANLNHPARPRGMPTVKCPYCDY